MASTFTPVKVNNGYSYQIKNNAGGGFGVDYFDQNGKPITGDQLMAATGQNFSPNNVLSISQQAVNRGITNPFTSTIGQDKATSTPTPFSTVQANPQTTSASIAQPTGAGLNGFSGSYYLPPVTYLGQTYDQNDPAQAAALLAAKQSTLGGQRDQQISQINRGLGESLDQAALTQGQQLGTFNQNATDYGRSVANNIVDLGQNHDLGQVNSQQQFAGLSPNAFQSGQGTSQQYGDQQYGKGLNQINQGLDETVGGNYFNNGQIDPNSTIGKQIAGLNSQYNFFTGDARNNAQLGIQNANNAYGQGMDQNLSNLQALYNYAGKSFNYQGDNTYNPNSLPNVDISQYSPYTNSQQLGQSPQAQQPSPSQWNGSSNPFSGLLGYSPTAAQSGYLNAFLGKYGTPSTATGN